MKANYKRVPTRFGAETRFEVSPAVVERATDLRARYNLKTPDAIHYATAVEVGATVFLTGDRALSRCSEVPVEVL